MLGYRCKPSEKGNMESKVVVRAPEKNERRIKNSVFCGNYLLYFAVKSQA